MLKLCQNMATSGWLHEHVLDTTTEEDYCLKHFIHEFWNQTDDDQMFKFISELYQPQIIFSVLHRQLYWKSNSYTLF